MSGWVLHYSSWIWPLLAFTELLSYVARTHVRDLAAELCVKVLEVYVVL